MPTIKLKPEPVECEVSPNLVLVPELTPRPLWGKGAGERLGADSWSALRESVFAHSGHTCAACGASDGLVCCERWQYDDEDGVAILEGFRALCERCDDVVHMGRAVRLGMGAETLERLCRVNRIDPYHALALFGEAVALWRSRSKRDWRVSVDLRLLRQFPELLALCDTADANVLPN